MLTQEDVNRMILDAIRRQEERKIAAEYASMWLYVKNGTAGLRANQR